MGKKKKKKNKKVEPGHLVEKTIGSSNEISFDVLEQMKKVVGEEEPSEPWVMSTAEVQAKRKSRKQTKILLALVFVMLILLVVLGATFLIANFLERQNGTTGDLNSEVKDTLELSDDNADFRKSLNSLFIDTGAVIGTEDIVSKYEKQLEQANKSITNFEKKKTNINRLMGQLATPFQKTLGEGAISLIGKETDIINRANSAKDYSLKYLKERKLAVDGYSLITKSQELDSEATESFLKGGEDNAKAAIEKANQAKEYASDAKKKFDELYKSSSSFDNFVTYCQLKVDAQTATVAAASAYIARNKEEMDKQNNVYNELQEEAQSMARSLEEKPYETLDSAFYEKRKDDSDAFVADFKQRDYVYNKVEDELKKNG